jgi:hypothetical protein
MSQPKDASSTMNQTKNQGLTRKLNQNKSLN